MANFRKPSASLDDIFQAAERYVNERNERLKNNSAWTTSSDIRVRSWERFALTQAFVAGAESVKDGVELTTEFDQFWDRADEFLKEFESTSIDINDGIVIGTFGSYGHLYYANYMGEAVHIAFLKGIEFALKIRLT